MLNPTWWRQLGHGPQLWSDAGSQVQHFPQFSLRHFSTITGVFHVESCSPHFFPIFPLVFPAFSQTFPAVSPTFFPAPWVRTLVGPRWCCPPRWPRCGRGGPSRWMLWIILFQQYDNGYIWCILDIIYIMVFIIIWYISTCALSIHHMKYRIYHYLKLSICIYINDGK